MIDNLIHKAVAYFNSKPANQRVINAGDVYIMTMHHMNATVEQQFDEGDLRDSPDDWPSPSAMYTGTGRYLWVGGPGVNITATVDDFIPLAMEISSTELVQLTALDEPTDFSGVIDGDWMGDALSSVTPPMDFANTINVVGITNQEVDDLWISNPIYGASGTFETPKQDFMLRLRPLYSMEQMVFNFPTINNALTQQNSGGNVLLAPMVSLKPLAFDEMTDIQVSFNPHTADTNQTNGNTQIRFSLYHTTVFDDPSPFMEGVDPILTVYFSPSSPRNISVSYEANDNETALEANKRGLSGNFFWVWESTNFGSITADTVINSLSITLYTKARTKYYDNASFFQLE